MKIKMGKYPHWIQCQIHTRYMNKKYDWMNWPDEQSKFEDRLEKLEDFIQGIYNATLNKLVRKEQKVSIKIDSWDTWGMDHTLSYIIVPMLKQLKATKQGAPIVDQEDVPEELQATEEDVDKMKNDGSTDENFFKRWDWVLDEMIWAFEQKNDPDSESQFFTDIPDASLDDGSFDTKMASFTVDRVGLAAHNKRMQNGFVLFGKYFTSLWD
jgi:hypothetical protein